MSRIIRPTAPDLIIPRRRRMMAPTFYIAGNERFRGAVLAAAGFQPTSSQSAAFLTRATGITSDTDKANYDALITGLVTDGVWSSLDCLYIFAAPNRATAVLNLVQISFAATENGTINFSAYQGYTGDNATFYLDTGFNPNTAGGNYTQTSASFGVYDQTTVPSGGNHVPMGVAVTIISNIIPSQFGGSQLALNGGGLTGTLLAHGFSQGSVIPSVNSGNPVYYFNGGSPQNSPNPTTGLPTDNFYIFAENASGAALFVPDQISAAFIGGGLTAAQISSLSTRVNTFMTAYGINVY